jgi:hypothetical protein
VVELCAPSSAPRFIRLCANSSWRSIRKLESAHCCHCHHEPEIDLGGLGIQRSEVLGTRLKKTKDGRYWSRNSRIGGVQDGSVGVVDSDVGDPR